MDATGMPWWGEVILAAAGLVVLPVLAWVVIGIIKLGNEQVRLNAMIGGISKDCARHQQWQDTLDQKITDVQMTQAKMLGHLEAAAGVAAGLAASDHAANVRPATG